MTIHWQITVIVCFLALFSIHCSSGAPSASLPLTEDQKARVEEIATRDPRVVSRLAGRDYSAEVGPWAEADASGSSATRTGAAVTFFTRDGSEYFREFLATVDLSNGAVVDIYDLPKKAAPPKP